MSKRILDVVSRMVEKFCPEEEKYNVVGGFCGIYDVLLCFRVCWIICLCS